MWYPSTVDLVIDSFRAWEALKAQLQNHLHVTMGAREPFLQSLLFSRDRYKNDTESSSQASMKIPSTQLGKMMYQREYRTLFLCLLHILLLYHHLMGVYPTFDWVTTMGLLCTLPIELWRRKSKGQTSARSLHYPLIHHDDYIYRQRKACAL